MANGSKRALASAEVHHFAFRLAESIERNAGLLDGLAALRAAETVPVEIIDDLLALKELRLLRVGWELWSSLTAAAGDDPEVILIGAVPYWELDRASVALWGKPYGSVYE